MFFRLKASPFDPGQPNIYVQGTCVNADGDAVYLVTMKDNTGTFMLVHTYRNPAIPPAFAVYPSDEGFRRFHEYARECRAGANPHKPCWFSGCVRGEHPGSAAHLLQNNSEVIAPRARPGIARAARTGQIEYSFWLRIEVSDDAGATWEISEPDMDPVIAPNAYEAAMQFDASLLARDNGEPNYGLPEYRVSVYSRCDVSDTSPYLYRYSTI